MSAVTSLTPGFKSALCGLVRAATTPAPSVTLDPGTPLLSCKLAEKRALVQKMLGISTVWARQDDLLPGGLTLVDGDCGIAELLVVCSAPWRTVVVLTDFESFRLSLFASVFSLLSLYRDL